MNTELWGLRSFAEVIKCVSHVAFVYVFIINPFCLTGGTSIGLAKISTTAAPVRTRRASYTGISPNCGLLCGAGSRGSAEHTSTMSKVQKAGRGKDKYLSLKMEGVCAMFYLVPKQGLFLFLSTGSRSKSSDAIGSQENRYPSNSAYTSASHLSYLSGGGERNSGSLEVCPTHAEYLESRRGQDGASYPDLSNPSPYLTASSLHLISYTTRVFYVNNHEYFVFTHK